MRDKRGFWLAVGGLCLGVAGVLLVQYALTSDQAERDRWVLPAALVLSIVPLVFGFALLTSAMSGWGPRAKRLEAMGAWDVIAPILRSDRMAEELRRVSPAFGGRTIPRGLTLAANGEGIGIWSGRRDPVGEVWLPWANILDIQPAVARELFESYRGIAISAQWGSTRVEFPVSVAGGFPFGARIATSTAVDELVGRLRRARERGHRATAD
jgi:hypothetical protein